ncbi:MAG: D-alanyl-D-alanine carboxypeptidase family protein [Clostridia bacterium]|nr:D-alanyl-D-alanine carboxypeptidase family protein [Clostridia bacterium]
MKSRKGIVVTGAVLAVLIIAAIVLIKKNVEVKEQDTKQTSTSVQETQKTNAQSVTNISEVQTQTTNSKTTTEKTFVEAATITIDESKWNLTLLNRDYKLPDGYVPQTAGINVSDNDPRRGDRASSQVLDYRVAVEYQKMYDAAAAQGIYLTPYSGYRSIEHQSRIFNSFVDTYKNKGYSTNAAKYEASKTSLPPGTSEHNMGMAMDIVNTKTDFVNSKEYAWLDANAQNYGFILRYPEDKTEVTQIVHEPWHWRYVGTTAAKEMKQSGQCLEEYLGVK